MSKILNHVEAGVTAVYDRHGYDAEKRAALDFWGKRVEAIIANKRDDGADVPSEDVNRDLLNVSSPGVALVRRNVRRRPDHPCGVTQE